MANAPCFLGWGFPAPRCSWCGRESFYAKTHRQKRCSTCCWVRSNREYLVDPMLPYSRDPAAQLFVAHFASGASLEQRQTPLADLYPELARLFGVP